MNNIFTLAEACLHHPDIEQKLTLTHQAQQLQTQGDLSLVAEQPAFSISMVQFPSTPILLSAREMPKRKLGSPDGIKAFFHAIAHVEFMSI